MKPDVSAVAPQKLLRMREVEKLVGLTEGSIYWRIKAGKFPSQVALSGRAVAWREEEVLEFLKGRPKRTRPPDQVVSMVPDGEPSPEMVRALLAKSGHTVTSAAEALGVTRRTLQRYLTNGPRWQRPRPLVLAVLNMLPPPREMLPILRRLQRHKAYSTH
jgi:prophage regulatory protein